MLHLIPSIHCIKLQHSNRSQSRRLRDELTFSEELLQAVEAASYGDVRRGGRVIISMTIVNYFRSLHLADCQAKSRMGKTTSAISARQTRLEVSPVVGGAIIGLQDEDRCDAILDGRQCTTTYIYRI